METKNTAIEEQLPIKTRSKKRPPPRGDRASINSRASYWREARRHLKRALKAADEDDAIDKLDEDYLIRLVHRTLFSGGPYSTQTRRRYMREFKLLLDVLARARIRDLEWVNFHAKKLEAALKDNQGKKRGKPRLATFDEVKTIFQNLRDRYFENRRLNLALAAFMILIIEKTAMRPIEISTARVEGSSLVIQNAKRRPGEPLERRMTLNEFPHKFQENLPAMLALFPHRSQYAFEKMRNRLAETIARACETNGIERLSLYSFRHLRISIWIQSGALAEVVAVLSGHLSTMTAKQHYSQPVSKSWGPQYAHVPMPLKVNAEHINSAMEEPGLMLEEFSRPKLK